VTNVVGRQANQCAIRGDIFRELACLKDVRIKILGVVFVEFLPWVMLPFSTWRYAKIAATQVRTAMFLIYNVKKQRLLSKGK